ncbi:MAG: hypothetical protein K2L70_00430 [Clostridia bacterium]|nr:hypothetical protein [Clostridia bacterium]
MQIVKAEPKVKTKFELKAMPYEKIGDNLLADLHDRIEDSIKEYYEYYCRSLFEEMLIDKLRI